MELPLKAFFLILCQLDTVSKITFIDIQTAMRFGRLFKWLLFLAATSFSGVASAQVTFVVDHLPENTPEQDTIFITGNFNNWTPGNPAHALTRNAADRHSITLPDPGFPLSYKFTRGNWDKVEGDELGNATTDRVLEAPPEGPVSIHISTWEDMPPRPAHGSVTVIVDRLPENTPPASPVYIVGNFNSWHPADPRYQLFEQSDGTYRTEVPVYGNRLEFKFTRGNWETVEGRLSGRARFNRVFEYESGGENEVRVQIETWEDLSGNPINSFTFLLVIAAVLGLLLTIAINTLHNNNKPANRILSALILLISVVLAGRVAIYDRDIFQAYPKLLLVPDLILFLYAPLFILYIRKLLLAKPLRWNSRLWLHFIPFVLHVIAYAPLYTMDNFTIISRNVDLSLRPWFVVTGGIALAYNLFYWWYTRRLLKKYQRASEDNYTFEQNFPFLNTVMNLKAICLVLWAGTYLLGGLDLLLEADLAYFTDRSMDLLFIVFSLTVFCLAYFAIREPELFKLPPELEEEEGPALPAEETAEAKSWEEWTEMKDKLSGLMEREKPYLNPKLTLGQLAEMAETNPHTLSRVINEGFEVNFNDFVNSYRVGAFKNKLQDPANQNLTLLAVALDVGFNSKTAFNRSFKKLSGTTPREWMKAQG